MQTVTNIHHAVIVENTVSDAMAPLLEKRSIAMLPVAGKPQLQYWCEHMSLAGVENLKIFVRRYPEQVRAFVGKGERWGLNIEVITLPEASAGQSDYSFILPGIKQDTLIASLDRFPAINLSDWLKAETVTNVFENDLALESIKDLAIVDEKNIQDMVKGKSVSLKANRNMATRRMHSPRDYWQINMDVLNGKIPDPLPLGYEVENGLYVEAGVQIKPGFAFNSACRLGRHSLIDTDVSLGDSVVIGADSIIDRNSSVNESVILDHTYVGSHSALNRIIADGAMIYHVDLDQATWIDDPSIIGSTKAKQRKVSFTQRAMALVMLTVLMAPIIVFYLGRHLGKKSATTEDTLYLPSGRNLAGEVDYKTLNVLSLDVEHPAWRKATWLINVVKGDLALVGTSAQKNSKVIYPEWAVDHIWEMPGVINLEDLNQADLNRADLNRADISANSEMNSESRFVSDAYYLATRGLKTNLKIIFKWMTSLFTVNRNQSNQVKFKGV